MKRLPLLEKIILVLLLVIFGGIVLQAPLSVGFGALFPKYDLLIKSWKELLMLVVGLLLLVVLVQKKRLRLLKDPLLIVAAAYGLLHILLLPFDWQGVTAAIAGLLIDLRYVFFFAIAYLFLRLHPEFKKQFIITFVIGGLVVVVFALLQVFVLPADFLKYLGYSKHTIAPYLTVDQNHSYIRINSTLRGPNPLGAYAVIILSFIGAVLLKRRLPPRLAPRIIVAVLCVGAVVALWASYSRSAVIGAVVALGLLGVVTVLRKASRKVWIGVCIVLCALGGGLIASWNTPFMSQVILHENPTRANLVNSNDGHVSSLQNGFGNMLRQPLGGGIGSTGSASLYSHHPMIVENHYLFEAHEVGWLGLVLFLMLFGMILVRLWRARDSSLALGVFVSGVGLAVIGLLLPVWTDDTVSIIWWGLAAVVLATRPVSRYNKASETVV